MPLAYYPTFCAIICRAPPTSTISIFWWQHADHRPVAVGTGMVCGVLGSMRGGAAQSIAPV